MVLNLLINKCHGERLIIIFLLYVIKAPAQPFLNEGNVWTYSHLGYNSWVSDKPLCAWHVEKFYVHGERKIDGMMYKEIWIQRASILEPVMDEESYFLVDTINQITPPTYYCSLREGGHRIFARVQELNSFIGLDMEPVNGWFPYEGDEYIVYNFDIPQSNVIPFVGHINYFLLPSPIAPNGIIWNSFLNLFYNNHELAYQSPNFTSDPFYPELAPTAIHDLPAQPAAEDSGSKIQVSGSKIYDLSGRRLSAPPAKGMYIQDKRVKIRE